MFRPIAISLSPNTEKDDIILAIRQLFSPWGYIEGDATERLEKWFTHYFTVPYAVSFASGRAALYIVLKALGVGVGDEVIIQSFTCVAVCNSIIATGARPVYADIDEALNMSVLDIEEKISKKTKAIITQHTFGIPADIDRIMQISEKYKIPVIEDCAHSIGTKVNGKTIGTFGTLSIFSFGRDKAFSSVSGGMAITKDKVLGKKIKEFQEKLDYPSLSWITSNLFHPIAFSLILPMYNLLIGKILLVIFQKLHFLTIPVYSIEKKGKMETSFIKKMPNAQAVLALHQLKKHDRFNATRNFFVEFYRKELSEIGAYKLPYDSINPLLRFPVLTDKRDKIIKDLKKRGIYLGKWYSEIIDPKGVNFESIGYKIGSCPRAENIVQRILNLPTYPTLSSKQAKEIVQFLKQYARNA